MTSAKLTTMCKLSEFFTYTVVGKYARRIGKEIFCVCQQNLDFDVNKTVRQCDKISSKLVSKSGIF